VAWRLKALRDRARREEERVSSVGTVRTNIQAQGFCGWMTRLCPDQLPARRRGHLHGVGGVREHSRVGDGDVEIYRIAMSGERR